MGLKIARVHVNYCSKGRHMRHVRFVFASSLRRHFGFSSASASPTRLGRRCFGEGKTEIHLFFFIVPLQLHFVSQCSAFCTLCYV